MYSRNHHVDGLIDASAAVTDDTERQVLYARAWILAEAPPYVPFWYRSSVAVFKPDLDGVRRSAFEDFTSLTGVGRRPAENP